VVEHRPGGECECGADLAEAADEGVERACQVTDVPLVTARTTEHRMHRVRCGCGREHVAAAPAHAGTANTRVYGPNLRALVVYLLVYQHVPVHRCVRLVADLTGAGPSVGFVHGMLARCADALAEVIKVIKTLVTLAYVAHFDETTLRVGKAGVKKYVWSASTGLYTVFTLGRRSGEQFRLFNVGTRFRGVAVHDRYGVYDMSGVFAERGAPPALRIASHSGSGRRGRVVPGRGLADPVHAGVAGPYPRRQHRPRRRPLRRRPRAA
jgi:hypothetical protein